MDEGRTDNPPVRISSRESRIHIPSRATIHTVDNPGPTQDAGLPFWNKLTPEMQVVIAGPIRRTEEAIAKHFPDGYVSPFVAKANSIKDQDGLEEQHDATSCSFVSTANALRLLDSSRPEYSKDTLMNLAGSPRQLLPNHLRTIFNSSPFNQFTLETPQAKVRLLGNSDLPPDMLTLFEDLKRGDVAVAGWRSTPNRVVGQHGEGNIHHARTIAGFSKGPDNTLKLHVIDPYGARQEVWSFRDWIVAMRMDYPFDNPSYSPEEVRGWMSNLNGPTGLMRNIAEAVDVIHKKKPQIVVHSKQ